MEGAGNELEAAWLKGWRTVVQISRSLERLGDLTDRNFMTLYKEKWQGLYQRGQNSLCIRLGWDLTRRGVT